MAPTYSRPNDGNGQRYNQRDQRDQRNYNDRNCQNGNEYYNSRNNNDRNYNGYYNRDNNRDNRRNDNRSTKQELAGELTFKRDFDPKDLRMIKHMKTVTTRNDTDNTETTETTTVYLPQYPTAGTPWMLVYCVSAFNNEKAVMGWTAPEKLYEKFNMQIEDKDEWNGCITEKPGAQTKDGFYKAVEDLLTEKFSSNAWGNHAQFLQTYKKPGSVTPRELYTGYKQHNQVLPGLPGVPTDGTPKKFTPYQLKQIVHNAMPERFQNNYIGAGKSLGTDSINDVIAYMEGQHKLCPFKPRTNNNNYNRDRRYNDTNQDRSYNNDNQERNNRSNRPYQRPDNSNNRNGNSNGNGNSQRDNGNNNQHDMFFNDGYYNDDVRAKFEKYTQKSMKCKKLAELHKPDLDQMMNDFLDEVGDEEQDNY